MSDSFGHVQTPSSQIFFTLHLVAVCNLDVAGTANGCFK